MPKLTVDELVSKGFAIGGEQMENGELRARLTIPGGSGYIWTEPPKDVKPAWQNAHFHKGVKETYVVERGRMAIAFMADDEDSPIGDEGIACWVRMFRAGDVVTTKPDEAHNVYLFPGSAIHTVKHGEPIGNPEKGGADWWPAPAEFDVWTKGLGEQDILRLAK
jgi:mannose-6-phosphate isomerase-like protein (cupin superfamily)